MISILILLWLENILCMISILLNLIRFILRARNMTYIGEYSMCTLKGCLFYFFWGGCGGKGLEISVRLSWLVVFVFLCLKKN